MTQNRLARLKLKLYREQAQAARLGYAFEAFARGFSKNPGSMREFGEWLGEAFLPEYLQRDPYEAKPPVYSAELVAAFAEALKRGLVSQGAFARLGHAELRQSGWGRQ